MKAAQNDQTWTEAIKLPTWYLVYLNKLCVLQNPYLICNSCKNAPEFFSRNQKMKNPDKACSIHTN